MAFPTPTRNKQIMIHCCFVNILKKKKIKFDLISIWDHDYNTSGKGRKFQEKSIRNNFKQLQFFKVLNYKKKIKFYDSL